MNFIPCDKGSEICNLIPGSRNLATGKLEWSQYGYDISNWSVYLFMGAFGVAALAHFVIAIWKRHWWVIGTLGLGCAIEAVGWGGRMMSLQSKIWDQNMGGIYRYSFDGFIMQVVCTVVAPTFFSAANYIILGKLINATGGLYSILTPRSFAIIFMTADFVCLVVQGAGGGIAGTADTTAGANNGAYIMTGGVVLQLVITVLFVVLLIDFVRRFRSNKPAKHQRHPLPNWSCLGRPKNTARSQRQHPLLPRHDYKSVGQGEWVPTSMLNNEMSDPSARRTVWLLVTMLLFTTLLIVIRSVYRSIELTDGWEGHIAVNQMLFLALDAFLMALLGCSYLVIHPAFYLAREKL